MNILLANHYAGSIDMGMAFRPYYFAREWVKMGHNVTILAGDFSHLRKNNPEVTRDFQEQNVDGIKYCWVKTGAYHGNGAVRALTMFRFVGKLWFNAQYLVDRYKPDIVIASSTYPIDTFACQRIAKLAHAKLIHEVHDMWPATLIEVGGMSRKHPFVQLMQWGENSFCRNSDGVVSILPCAKEYFVEHGMEENKFFHVPNGIVLSEWIDAEPLPDEHSKLLVHLHNNHQFVIGFFGSHTKSYCLEHLIEAIRKLQDDSISVVFVGDGTDKKQMMKMASDLNNSIYFLPPVSKTSIPTLTKMFDAIYVGAVDNTMFSFGIGMNKLFDAMMSGKPILYAVNAPNNYIKDYSCGINVKPENVEDLMRGIKELIHMTDGERHDMGERGNEAVLKHFNYDVLPLKFIDIMNQVLER